MAGLPAHPENDDDASIEPASGGSRWRSVLGIGVLIALVVLFVALHLTGVIGPEAH